MVFTLIAAAGAVCQGQVYGIDGKLMGSHGHNDELCILTYTYSAGDLSSSVEWYVSTNTLARQPRWDAFSAEPPLSIRSACLLALPQVTNQFPHILSWAVESVSLCNLDSLEGGPYSHVRCYEVVFAPRDPEIRKRLKGNVNFTQIVLLDGTVLPPRIVKNE